MFTRKAAGVLATALALTVATAPAAFAINRDPGCAHPQSDLVLYSPSTTCWFNAGTVSVRLYSVRTVDNNTSRSGYVRAIDGRTVYFGAHTSFTYSSLQTITVVHLN